MYYAWIEMSPLYAAALFIWHPAGFSSFYFGWSFITKDNTFFLQTMIFIASCPVSGTPYYEFDLISYEDDLPDYFF